MKLSQLLPLNDAPAIGFAAKRCFILASAIAVLWSGIGRIAHAQVHWRTPDRFVTPATDIEQDPPPNMLPADPPSATPKTPPTLTRSSEKPLLAPPASIKPPPPPDDPLDATENDDPNCVPDRCDPIVREHCWEPAAGRVEARVEWLLWFGKGDHVPPLVTTGPSAPRDQAGVLGAPGTAVLFGDEGLNESASNGARFGLDYWLTRDHGAGVEFQYFFLGQNTQSFQADDNSFPVLARPIFNTETQSMDSALIAYPGAQTGNVNVVATSDLQGAEALLRKTWYCRPCARLDFLVGYRYVRLSDDLRMDEFETFIDPAGTVPVGSTLALTDRFSTINEFQGADFGIASDWRHGRFDWGVLLKIGLGNTNSRVSISGNTVATEPTLAPVTTQGGLLAQASNIGQFEQNQFTMLPELGVNLGFDLTRRLRLTGGYSLLYWGGVARSGDQIDLNLAPAQFPPSQNAAAGRFPQFRFAATDYWAQGLSLGLDYRF